MNNKKIIIDYLSLTFPLKITDDSERDEVYKVVNIFKEYFKLEGHEIDEPSRTQNNYRYQFVLSKYIILRCAGPENDFGYRTCQLELKGEGCREFERLKDGKDTWYGFLVFLMKLNPSFKRIDVTIDDFSGEEITLDYLFQKIDTGCYTSVFKSEPKIHGTLSRGLTIDMGSRTSMIELCIYDKYRQQKSLGNDVDYNYWTRYEMRFRQKKADSVVMELIQMFQNLEDLVYGMKLKEFAIKSLYGILDIKEKLRDDMKHLCREETDPKWLSFLENTEKGILPKADARELTITSSTNYIMPKAKMILLLWFVEAGCNKKLFEERLYHELYELLLDTSRMQLKRFNQFLAEKKMKTIDQTGFENYLKEISKIIEEGELPF